MGLVYANVELSNGDDLSDAGRGLIQSDAVRRMDVQMLVDSGAYVLAVNAVIVAQLGLRKLDETAAELADGSVIALDVVGPVGVRFANRRIITQAAVLPGDAEPLLGAVPMEEMDVLIDPKRGELVVNPKHPFKRGGPLK